MKLFISDLDGTLLNEEHFLDDHMREYILELRKEGHLFGVATGRPYGSALVAIPDMKDIFDFGVFNNGANFVDFKDGEEHDQYPLSKETLLEILDVYGDQLGANPVMFFDDIMYTHRKTDYHRRLTESGYNIQYGDFRDKLKDSHEKIIFAVDENSAQTIFDYYDANPSDDFVCFMSQAELLEFMDPRINKWEGVDYFIQKYQLQDMTSISFGDNGNDMQLVQSADIGVAMENAIEELRQEADHIAKHHGQSGVYHFIKDYLNKE